VSIEVVVSSWGFETVGYCQTPEAKVMSLTNTEQIVGRPYFFIHPYLKHRKSPHLLSLTETPLFDSFDEMATDGFILSNIPQL